MKGSGASPPGGRNAKLPPSREDLIMRKPAMQAFKRLQREENAEV
jgi:hypothetical protein